MYLVDSRLKDRIAVMERTAPTPVPSVPWWLLSERIITRSALPGQAYGSGGDYGDGADAVRPIAPACYYAHIGEE